MSSSIENGWEPSAISPLLCGLRLIIKIFHYWFRTAFVNNISVVLEITSLCCPVTKHLVRANFVPTVPYLSDIFGPDQKWLKYFVRADLNDWADQKWLEYLVRPADLWICQIIFKCFDLIYLVKIHNLSIPYFSIHTFYILYRFILTFGA